jgi:hypothetical protein
MLRTMDRSQLIEQYEQGPHVVEAMWASLGEDERDRRPAPGEWTAREVCHHLADSETTSYVRLRRLLAEDAPEIVGYDQDQFARVLHYDRPVEASLAVLRAVRTASSELLRLLTDDDWKRSGTHTEDGPYSVERWLQSYAAHAHDHADQMQAAAARTRTGQSKRAVRRASTSATAPTGTATSGSAGDG